MAAPIAFESTWKNKELREAVQEEREKYIKKLKAKHEREEWKKEQARMRGEDTWMLDSVTARLDEEKKDLEKALKKKKKEKKHKKDKKKHKHKKKKKKHDDSSSDSDSSEEKTVWSEKSTVPEAETSVVKGPSLQRDSWMLDPLSDFGALPSITKTEYNEQRQKNKGVDKEAEKKAKQMLEEPGQHEKELNPYWKEGGTGLPEEQPSKKKKAAAISVDIAAGDGGAGWWQRAYQRCVEQAKEQGKTLEEVAADRYGSLKNLEAMLAAATKNEKKLKTGDRHESYSDYRTSDRRYDHCNRTHDDQYKERSHRTFRKPDTDDWSFESPSKSTYSKSSHRDSPPRWKKRSSQETYQESPSSSDHMERKRRFLKPDENAGRPEKKKTLYEEHRDKPRWKKEDFTEGRLTEERRQRGCERENSQDGDGDYSRRREEPDNNHSSQRQMERRHRIRDEEQSYDTRRDNEREQKEKYKRNVKKTQEHSSSSEESSCEDSSPSSSSESESEKEPSTNDVPDVKILTDQELNELGAKMVKAELMGNEELAAKIKTEIEQGRKAREMHIKSQPLTNKKEKTKDTEEVLLTRTDRFGNVRPLQGREHTESSQPRRREKVKTHSQGGSRERYFHDDDNKDLKALVEQERLGTAEDSNRQFIKLAGKAFGGRQGLEDMDEVFMEGASKKTSAAKLELRERSQAIAEHKKISTAMERCQFCFDKVPKHLIIAIGLKVYLCLPNHRSMTEGHCLIVPMQHLTQSTNLDEDVFEEIQVFRRALTKMYQMHDLDCVFMETCKDLHRHPHMAVECVPLPKELGDVAPIYFKKAIQESESEWSHNKKVVDLSKKNIRNAVPKGFPYFAVNFGLQGGFAHVIEEEKSFPHYFGREILGGMLDLEPALWRKPHKESFDEQRKKVLAFAEWWKPVDWTQKLRTATDSD